ncbi:hypothetical protein [Chromobacterium phragmitis]|nr:hypothetical protein [Chromobacterium phragmitis]
MPLQPLGFAGTFQQVPVQLFAQQIAPAKAGFGVARQLRQMFGPDSDKAAHVRQECHFIRLHCFLRLSWLERGLPDRVSYCLAHLPRSRYFLYLVQHGGDRFAPLRKAALGKAAAKACNMPWRWLLSKSGRIIKRSLIVEIFRQST